MKKTVLIILGILSLTTAHAGSWQTSTDERPLMSNTSCQLTDSACLATQDLAIQKCKSLIQNTERKLNEVKNRTTNDSTKLFEVNSINNTKQELVCIEKGYDGDCEKHAEVRTHSCSQSIVLTSKELLINTSQINVALHTEADCKAVAEDTFNSNPKELSIAKSVSFMNYNSNGTSNCFISITNLIKL